MKTNIDNKLENFNKFRNFTMGGLTPKISLVHLKDILFIFINILFFLFFEKRNFMKLFFHNFDSKHIIKNFTKFLIN